MNTRTAVRSILVAGTLVVLSAAAVAGGAEARGKPGGGGGTAASISLNQSDPHLGDLVTFTASGGSRIALACYQGGVTNMVYSADQATGTAFLLGGTSSQWKTNGGDALCYAWLYNRSLSKGFVASTSFNAAGS